MPHDVPDWQGAVSPGAVVLLQGTANNGTITVVTGIPTWVRSLMIVTGIADSTVSIVGVESSIGYGSVSMNDSGSLAICPFYGVLDSTAQLTWSNYSGAFSFTVIGSSDPGVVGSAPSLSLAPQVSPIMGGAMGIAGFQGPAPAGYLDLLAVAAPPKYNLLHELTLGNTGTSQWQLFNMHQLTGQDLWVQVPALDSKIVDRHGMRQVADVKIGTAYAVGIAVSILYETVTL